MGRGLVTNGGVSHRRHRKVVQPAFHAKRIHAYADSMVELTEAAMTSWRDGQVVDVTRDMMALTMKVVAKCLFDADLDRGTPGSTERIAKAIEELHEIANEEVFSGNLLPTWVPTPTNMRRNAARRVLDETIASVIAERRKTEVGGEVADRGDLLSMLLLSRDETGARLDDREVRDEFVTIFVAGHETTSSAVTSSMLLLARHRDIQTAWHDEIDSVLAGRRPRAEDASRLALTGMIAKEALRLFPPAWVLAPRQPTRDTRLGDYPVSAATQIFVSPYVLHRLPQHFHDPERFDPTRFSPENEAEISRFAYIPFGLGHRSCLGGAFALMEMQLILATVGQRFELELVRDEPFELQPRITLSTKHGTMLRARKRATAATAPSLADGEPAH
jgi:cytochrome P450